MRNGIVVLIVIGIFFGSILFIGTHDKWQEAQIEKERLDRQSREKIELEKIKAERERIEAEKERVEAERLEAQKSEVERLESLKTPEQKEAELLEAERINQERIDRSNQERKENLKSNTSNVENAIIEQSAESTQMSLTCEDYQTTLNQISHMIFKLDKLCLKAFYGTYDDFDNFYDVMESLETGIAEKGVTVHDINNQLHNTFASVEMECMQDEDLQIYSTNVKDSLPLARMCYNDVYKKYGWFPLMELTSKNGIYSGQTTNTGQCELFCDSYGYEPYWAKSIGVYQAASKCTTILNNWESSDLDDQSWCTELAGYLVGQ